MTRWLSVDGSSEHLSLWGPDVEGNDATWTSSDAGATWKQASAAKKLPAMPRFVEVGGAKLEASTDGIVVRRPGMPSARVYPYKP